MISSIPSWIVSPSKNIQINSVAIDANGKYSVFGSSSEFDSGLFAVYCYNDKGEQCWKQPISSHPSYQGVFWVAISSDGNVAAAGGEFSKDNGFLNAYSVNNGLSLLSVKVKGRVNQVSLSHDGKLLLAVFDDTIQLYMLNSDRYELSSHTNLAGFYCNSCMLADNGQRAVVSAIQYHDDKSTSGKIAAFDIVNNQLTPLDVCDLAVGSMRVAITDNGENWGASLHDGSCALFNSVNTVTPIWTFKPAIEGLGLAYGFDMTQTAAGIVILAVGANKSGAQEGYLYVLQSHNSQPLFKWGAGIDYSINPGVSLDKEGRYVTATDGKPSDENAEHVKESPGSFYLYGTQTGELQWKYQTNLMNWPMMINQKGDKIIGASDNGSAYFWQK